jgi:hypothetical protein
MHVNHGQTDRPPSTPGLHVDDAGIHFLNIVPTP